MTNIDQVFSCVTVGLTKPLTEYKFVNSVCSHTGAKIQLKVNKADNRIFKCAFCGSNPGCFKCSFIKQGQPLELAEEVKRVASFIAKQRKKGLTCLDGFSQACGGREIKAQLVGVEI